MTKKRILFHASWALSCCLIGFAILTEACGAEDAGPKDWPCESNIYVTNQSGANCYISLKSEERMDFLAVYPDYATAKLHKSYTQTTGPSSCFDGKVKTDIYIWDQTGKLLIQGSYPIYGEDIYFLWDGTKLDGGNPK